MSDDKKPEPNPNQLVLARAKLRRQDRDWLKEWAEEHGLTLSVAISIAVTPGIEYLKTWGVNG